MHTGTEAPLGALIADFARGQADNAGDQKASLAARFDAGLASVVLPRETE